MIAKERLFESRGSLSSALATDVAIHGSLDGAWLNASLAIDASVGFFHSMTSHTAHSFAKDERGVDAGGDVLEVAPRQVTGGEDSSAGGGAASIFKLVWADWHKRLGEVAMDVLGPAGLVALLTAFGRTASGIVSERPSCLRQHPGRNSTPSPSPWTREYYLNVSHYNASTARSEKTPIGRCASSASWPSWARVPYPWLEWRNPEKTSSPLN